MYYSDTRTLAQYHFPFNTKYMLTARAAPCVKASINARAAAEIILMLVDYYTWLQLCRQLQV